MVVGVPETWCPHPAGCWSQDGGSGGGSEAGGRPPHRRHVQDLHGAARKRLGHDPLTHRGPPLGLGPVGPVDPMGAGGHASMQAGQSHDTGYTVQGSTSRAARARPGELTAKHGTHCCARSPSLAD